MVTDKQLIIKTNVVKRLTKDLQSYEKELSQNSRKLETLQASSCVEPSVIKQWEQVVSETQSMIPDTKDRLKAALIELNQIMQDDFFAESIELQNAKAVFDESSACLCKE